MLLLVICILHFACNGVVGRTSSNTSNTLPTAGTTVKRIAGAASISTMERILNYTTLSHTTETPPNLNTTTDGNVTPFGKNTPDTPAIHLNVTILHFYSLIAIPRMIHLWPKCLVGGDGNKSKTVVCEGVCALLITGTADYQKFTSYGCQRFKNYPKERINMCSDEFEPYPNVRLYYDRKKMERHSKLCCITENCNDPAKFEPMFPQRRELSESVELVTYEKVQCWCMIIVMVVIVVIPFYYVWEERQEAKKKKMSMDSHLERAVVQIGNENQPEFEEKFMTKLVTGKLNLTELSKVFSMIEHLQDKLNAPHAVVEIGDDIECTVYRSTSSGHGHNLIAASRGYTARYDNSIWNIIEHGPYKYPWTPFELVELFDRVKGQFEREDVLLRISAPLVIFGDIRGQYTDLHRWLSMVGYPPRKKLLFLGSILDESEPGSLDCFAFVMALKDAFPNSVFVLRGVGETIPMRFIHRFGGKLDSAVLTAMNRICAELPIAALISRKILAVHSGICHEIMSPKSFATLDRPFNYEEMPLFARQLIFNQPTTKVKTYRFEEETRSGSYGLEAVVRVCRDMNLRMIIRSRNPLDEGILWNRGSQCNKFYDLVSIWSAPAKNTNKGAVVEFEEESKIKVHLLEKQEEKFNVYL